MQIRHPNRCPLITGFTVPQWKPHSIHQPQVTWCVSRSITTVPNGVLVARSFILAWMISYIMSFHFSSLCGVIHKNWNCFVMCLGSWVIDDDHNETWWVSNWPNNRLWIFRNIPRNPWCTIISSSHCETNPVLSGACSVNSHDWDNAWARWMNEQDGSVEQWAWSLCPWWGLFPCGDNYRYWKLSLVCFLLVSFFSLSMYYMPNCKQLYFYLPPCRRTWMGDIEMPRVRLSVHPSVRPSRLVFAL